MRDQHRPITVVISEQRSMSLGEFCRCCGMAAEELLEMISEGMIQPRGSDPAQWRFSGRDLDRAHIALRLQRDLGTNLAGAALALELMDEMQTLRRRLRVLEQMLR